MTIKDDSSQLSVVMWKGMAQSLSFVPDQGVEVECYGKPNIYKGNGKFQVVVHKMEQAGEGLLQKKFLELKAKLEKEGLFDQERKRAIPFLPQQVGIITSKSGAAVHDIMAKISSRMPSVITYLYDARVQGDGAAKEVAAGLEYFNKSGEVDVIILGRGGGSLEDLWAFNEEELVRAIFASKIPVISAVGHEVDVSLSDLVSDKRAPTPTAAGEMVVPDRRQLIENLKVIYQRLSNVDNWFRPKVQSVDELEFRFSAGYKKVMSDFNLQLQKLKSDLHALEPRALFAELQGKINVLSQSMQGVFLEFLQRKGEEQMKLSQRLSLLSPMNTIRIEREKVLRSEEKLKVIVENIVLKCGDGVDTMHQLLQAFNPKSVLSRGFSLVRLGGSSGAVISDSSQLQIGSEVYVDFSQGSAKANIASLEKGVAKNDIATRKSTKTTKKSKKVEKDGKKDQGELFASS